MKKLVFAILAITFLTIRMAFFFERRSDILQTAETLQGTPYVYGKTDCSWLAMTTFGAAKIWLPRTSLQQKKYIRFRKFWTWEFFLLRFNSKPCHHVSIRAGGGYVWHASSKNGVEKIKAKYLK